MTPRTTREASLRRVRKSRTSERRRSSRLSSGVCSRRGLRPAGTQGQQVSALPFGGVSVLEVSGSFATSLCGKILADAGASVTRIELQLGERLQGFDAPPEWRVFLDNRKDVLELDPTSVAGRGGARAASRRNRPLSHVDSRSRSGALRT